MNYQLNILYAYKEKYESIKVDYQQYTYLSELNEDILWEAYEQEIRKSDPKHSMDFKVDNNATFRALRVRMLKRVDLLGSGSQDEII